jgi:hypothetical protein
MADTQSDVFRPGKGAQPPGDDETFWLLAQTLRLMHAPDNARVRREYEHVIRLLRQDASACVTAVGRWIDAAANDGLLRWSLLYILRDIQDEACLDLLRCQAMRQLPERIQRPGECEHSGDAEELVVVMSIGGLERLATAGNSDALAALLKVLECQDRKSLREPAAAALLRIQPELRRRIEELLPANEQHLLRLREATGDDLFVTVTDEDRRRKPKRRRTSPKPVLSKPPAAKRLGGRGAKGGATHHGNL